MNTAQNPNKKIHHIVTTGHIKVDDSLDYELEHSENPWMQELLDELEEGLNKEDFSTQLALNKLGRSTLSISLNIARRKNAELGDHFLASGKINAKYATPCIRCLAPIEEKLEVSFNTCFLQNTLQEHPYYKDQDTVLYKNEEKDLYFYEKKEVDLKEMIHEQIFLHLNQYPGHAEACPHPLAELIVEEEK